MNLEIPDFDLGLTMAVTVFALFIIIGGVEVFKRLIKNDAWYRPLAVLLGILTVTAAYASAEGYRIGGIILLGAGLGIIATGGVKAWQDAMAAYSAWQSARKQDPVPPTAEEVNALIERLAAARPGQ